MLRSLVGSEMCIRDRYRSACLKNPYIKWRCAKDISVVIIGNHQQEKVRHLSSMITEHPIITGKSRLLLRRAAIRDPLTILHFNKIFVDILTVILYKIFMRDANYFINPIHEWQKRYEALRASFVERLPAQAVAQRFGYSLAYVLSLIHI